MVRMCIKQHTCTTEVSSGILATVEYQLLCAWTVTNIFFCACESWFSLHDWL